MHREFSKVLRSSHSCPHRTQPACLCGRRKRTLAVLALGAGGPDVSPEVLREMRFSGIQSSSLAALGWTGHWRARSSASVAF